MWKSFSQYAYLVCILRKWLPQTCRSRSRNMHTRHTKTSFSLEWAMSLGYSAGLFWRSLFQRVHSSFLWGRSLLLVSFAGLVWCLLWICHVSQVFRRSLLKVSFSKCWSPLQPSFAYWFFSICIGLFWCVWVPFEGLFPYVLVTFAAFLRLLVPFDMYWSLLMCWGLFWRSLFLRVHGSFLLGRSLLLVSFAGLFSCLLWMSHVSQVFRRSLLKVSFPICWSPLQPSFVYWSLSISIGLFWCV